MENTSLFQIKSKPLVGYKRIKPTLNRVAIKCHQRSIFMKKRKNLNIGLTTLKPSCKMVTTTILRKKKS